MNFKNINEIIHTTGTSNPFTLIQVQGLWGFYEVETLYVDVLFIQLT